MSISLDDYNKVKSELELYKKLYFDLKISKCLDNINLKMENDSLNKKLEEKYNNCIDEKIKLKNEIEALKELLNPTKDSSKKRRVSVH
jgi:hypothetical protein